MTQKYGSAKKALEVYPIYFFRGYMKIYSFSPFGYEGALVSVEVDLRRGIPAIDIVGLADGAVKESRERMKSAIRNSGFEFPAERVLISLSPADLKKEGAGFDLAIALSVLNAKSLLSENKNCNDENWTINNNINENDSVLVIGELELNGSVRPVKAIHAAVSTALNAGITKCIVAEQNAREAREVKGAKVFGASNLTEAFTALYNDSAFTTKETNEELFSYPKDSIVINGIHFPPVTEEYDFIQIKNQKKLVRALQVAAAGRHNLLVFGPPGCGKTLSLQRFISLLPYLTPEESHSVTRIHSIAGLLQRSSPLIRIPPFRMPHQTASIEGICGGGPRCAPGEISLAHNGVLYLDEASEFRSSVLQMLRVPLENGMITLSRAGRSTVFPAQFQLLISTNPCPCGNYGSKERICLCSAKSVEMFWKKFSGPLLDRIDIRIHADYNKNFSSENDKAKDSDEGEAVTTSELRKEIAVAIDAQNKRQAKRNALLTPCEIEKYCALNSECKEVLEKAVNKYDFSPRAEASCKKLARTLSDMKGQKEITLECLNEAIQLRSTPLGLDMNF